MSWVKLDTGFPTHPKVIAAGPLATVLYVEALCYSAHHLTNGLVSPAVLRAISSLPRPQVHAKRLVSVGLWDVISDSEGWMIHDYDKHQTTREQVEHQRELATERVRRYRSNAVTSPLQVAGVTHLEEKRREVEKKVTTLSDPYESDFAECWTHYPRKEGRKPAYLAYVARRRANESPGDLLTATKNYARECRGKETEYIKLGSTFFGAKDWWRDKLSTNGNGSAPPETCEHCHAWVSANCTSPDCTYPPALEKRS